MRLQIELLPIEVLRAPASSFHYLREVIMGYLLLGIVFGHPPLILHDLVNIVFPPSHVNAAVKEFGVGIPFLNVCDSSTLLFTCSLQHGQAYDPSLKTSSKIALLGGEQPFLLSNVEAGDHQEGAMEVDLGFREEASTPFRETLRRFLELVEKDHVWVGMLNWLGPGLVDHVIEACHRSPKVLKFEGPRPPWPLIFSKQKRTVVGEGRGERM